MSGEGLQLFKRRHVNKELKKARECYNKPANIKAEASRWRQGGCSSFQHGIWARRPPSESWFHAVLAG